MSRFSVPTFPARLQGAQSITRGLMFAYRAGLEKGLDSNGLTAPEDRSKGRGDYQAAVGGNFTVNESGRALTRGTNSTSYNWSNPGGNYDMSSAKRVSASMVLKMNATVIVAGVFQKRAGLAAGNAGWALGVHSVDKYSWSTSDGVGEASLLSTTSTNITSTRVVSARGDNEVVGDLALFVNGAKETTGVGGARLEESANPPQIFQGGTNGQISQACAWCRSLNDAEHRALYVDPWRMWRPLHREFSFGLGAIVSANFNTYFLAT